MANLTRPTDGELVAFLDTIASVRLDAIAIPIVQVLDPAECPVALLPWLAWHYGLLHFDSRWEESLQREVIASARLLLRERGTRPGVERALEPFGDSAQLLERRDDPSLQPGAFVVRVPDGDGLNLDPDRQTGADTAVRRAAPLTRSWGIEVGDAFGWATLSATTTRMAEIYSVEGVANG